MPSGKAEKSSQFRSSRCKAVRPHFAWSRSDDDASGLGILVRWKLGVENPGVFGDHFGTHFGTTMSSVWHASKPSIGSDASVTITTSNNHLNHHKQVSTGLKQDTFFFGYHLVGKYPRRLLAPAVLALVQPAKELHGIHSYRCCMVLPQFHSLTSGYTCISLRGLKPRVPWKKKANFNSSQGKLGSNGCEDSGLLQIPSRTFGTLGWPCPGLLHGWRWCRSPFLPFLG